MLNSREQVLNPALLGNSILRFAQYSRISSILDIVGNDHSLGNSVDGRECACSLEDDGALGLALEDVAFDVSLVDEVPHDAHTLVEVFLAALQSYCPHHQIHLHFISHQQGQSFDQISPQKDSRPVHEQVDATFQPHLLILLAQLLVSPEVTPHHCLPHCQVLSVVAAFGRSGGGEDATKKQLTGDEVAQDQSFLALGAEVDAREGLLCLLEVFVDEGVLATLEVVVVRVPGRDLVVYLGRVEDSLDLFVVVEAEQDGDLHDVDERQELLLDLVQHRAGRLKPLQSVQQGVLQLRRSRTVDHVAFSRQEHSLSRTHHCPQGLCHPLAVLLQLLQHLHHSHQSLHVLLKGLRPTAPSLLPSEIAGQLHHSGKQSTHAGLAVGKGLRIDCHTPTLLGN